MKGSTGKSICSGCGRTFKTMPAFKRHRVGKHEIYPRMPGFFELSPEIQAQVRHCMTDEEMQKIGMRFEPEKNWWANKGNVLTPERKKRLEEKTAELKRKKELLVSEEEQEEIEDDEEDFEEDDEM